MATTLDVLKLARSYLAAGWTQGTAARNAEGDRAFSHSVEAVAWCPIGAVNRAAGGSEIFFTALDLVRSRRFSGTGKQLAAWNDEPGRTQAEVLALFDETIRELEAE